jgi:hypothetical protein
MNIEILGSTNGMDSAIEAWRYSRDLFGEVNAKELLTLDVPVGEMPSVHLLFEDFTILEREIMTSPRNHVVWARTSHVDDPLEFMIPEEWDDLSGFAEHCRSRMIKEKARGKSQDEWREHLPVISHTSWTARWSYRDLLKMTRYFNYLTGKVKSDLLQKRFMKVTAELAGVLTEVFTKDPFLTDDVMMKTKVVPFLHEKLLLFTTNRIEAAGSFTTIPLVVPLWLRAQIVRHRPLAFVDDFYAWLTATEIMFETISLPIRMELSTTEQYWNSVLSKRTCWIAQDTLSDRKDPWQEIIDQNGFSPGMLPCADGRCPYAKDAGLRLTDADPGAPCPRYIQLEALDIAPYVEKMRGSLTSRHPYWRDLVETNWPGTEL